MKVSQSTLKKALDQVKLVADTKATVAPLGSIRLSTTPQGLSLSATDLFCWLSTEIPAKERNEDFQRVVLVKGLLKVVGALPKKDVISLSPKEPDGLVLDYGVGQARLTGVDSKMFPELPLLPLGPPVYLEASEVIGALRKVSSCMCTDETRYHIYGIFFEQEEGQLWMTATDGHRLAHKPFPLDAPSSIGTGRILSGKAVNIIVSLFSKSKEQMALWFEEEGFWVQCEGVTLYTLWVKTEYASYRQAIPTKKTFSVQTSRAALRETALRLYKMTSTIHNALVLRLMQSVLCAAVSDSDIGEVEERLDCTMEGNCPDSFKAGINPTYLAEALESFEGENINISFGSEHDPILFESPHDSGIVVVMPMRV